MGIANLFPPNWRDALITASRVGEPESPERIDAINRVMRQMYLAGLIRYEPV